MKSKNPKSRATCRHLFLEGLEDRALMAGDVTAAVVDGVLTITGDDAANGVLIRQVSERPTVEGGAPVVKLAVVGVPLGEAATTINGYGKGFLVSAEGLTGVTINLGKGNDGLGFNNPKPVNAEVPPPVALPGIIAIAGGEGNDTVSGSIYNKTSLSINLGAGHDKLGLGNSFLQDLNVLGDPLAEEGSTVEPPAGEDQVYLERLTVKGKTTLGLGGGSDRVGIKGSSFTGSVSIGLGNGNDNLSIGSAPGLTPTSFAGGLEISGALGADVIGLGNVVVTGNTSNLRISTDPVPLALGVVDPPEPDDAILLESVKVGGLTTIATGSGADKIGIKGASGFTGAVAINGGSGNNNVAIGNPVAAPPMIFAGGLDIATGGHNDLIGLLNVSITGDGSVLKIVTDPVAEANATTEPPSGEDSVLLDTVKTSGGMIISTGGRGDRVGIKGASAFRGAVGINAGNGNNNVSIGNPPEAPAMLFSSGLEIASGGNNDLIGLLNVTVAGDGSVLKIVTDPLPVAGSTVEPPAGEDQVMLDKVNTSGPTTISTGGNNDRVTIRGASAFRGAVGIGLGAGNDGLLIGLLAPAPATTFGAGLEVGGGGGDDNINLTNVAVTGNLNVGAGDGSDKVYLDRVSATDSILASLGSGNDLLGVRGSRAPVASFDGGEGTDQLYSVENTFGTVTSVNFEPAPAPK